MPDSLKPARPHLVVGLSCCLRQAGSLEQLVNNYFSPVRPAQAPREGFCQQDLRRASPVDLLIASVRSAFADLDLGNVPEHSAVFVVLSEQIGDPLEAATALREYFQSLEIDLTVLLSNNTEESLNEALNWLDRGECEFAMVAVCDLVYESDYKAAASWEHASPPHPNFASLNRVHRSEASWLPAGIHEQFASTAVLLTSSSIAAKNKIKSYAQIQKADWSTTNPRSVALVDICTYDWTQEDALSNAWNDLRSRGTSSEQSAWTKHDKLAYISTLPLDLSGSSHILAPLLAVLTSSLSLQLRIIPASAGMKVKIADQNQTAQTSEPRPWIHPVSPVEPQHPRRSFVSFGLNGLLLSESGTDIDNFQTRLLKKQSSELFIIAGNSLEDLVHQLVHLHQDWSNSNLSFHELAFIQNCQSDLSPPYRVAIVASDREELLSLVQQAQKHIQESSQIHLDTGVASARGIYFAGPHAGKSGKLAFVLPGLGASYPQMLADLCCYFPEVRQVFDYVERLALKAGDQIIPSRAIFPVAGNSRHASSQTMLATMDSAVVTLLLAEWAIFALLKKLGVEPDVLLGCSTGEFAAITMSQAVDILEAAEIFYLLSTDVSRSVPLNKLSELRSIRVAASFEKQIAPLVASLQKPVYLGADFSDTCVLLSGEKEAMEELCRLLKGKNIEYLTLPVAIPYHTPLVSGKVSEHNEEVRSLRMQAPKVESWSCSTGHRYPDDANKLRKISTDLFEKPIKLRSTLLKMHDSGVRLFVELGPKGGLVPFITEVLNGKDHVALAANLQSRTGIDQLNSMLAVLACNGFSLNLKTLYERRLTPEQGRTIFAKTFSEEDLALGMQVHRSNEFESEALQMSESIYDYMQWSQAGALGELGVDLYSGDFGSIFAQSGLSDEVMITYLSSMQQMQESVLNLQETVMMAYLQQTEDDDEPGDPFGVVVLPESCPFLPNAQIQSLDDCFTIQFSFSTRTHPFLLDHAIGGNVKSKENSRVYLVPLMVELEIMAEAANLICPGRPVCRLTDVRAYKRIRIPETSLSLVLQLRPAEGNCVDARICLLDDDQDDSSLLASCRVEFSDKLASGPAPQEFPVNEKRESLLSPHRLYGTGSMFHGPLMQAVQSIDFVAKRSIGGKVLCKNSADWFADSKKTTQELDLLVNPLLLDNSSQFVLYHMYEHGYPVSALLPFHIESIEFFQGYNQQIGQTLFSRAFLRSMSLRGTDAQIEVTDAGGNVVCRVNDISSRAIVVPENCRTFIEEPERLICRRLHVDRASSPSAITLLSRAEMPDNETALDWFTDYVLTPAEQTQWRKVGRTDKRRKDWLSGRIAAKDAVRLLMNDEFNLKLKPADIQINSNEEGAPEVELIGIQAKWIPQVSISHSRNFSAAIAESPQNRGSGIDIEEVAERDNDFLRMAFSENDQRWIKSQAVKKEAITALWAAKEAAAKAHGLGFAGDFKSFELTGNPQVGDLMQIACKFDKDSKSSNIYTCIISQINNEQGQAVLAVVCGSLPKI